MGFLYLDVQAPTRKREVFDFVTAVMLFLVQAKSHRKIVRFSFFDDVALCRCALENNLILFFVEVWPGAVSNGG